jgi:hypothetical protein
MIHINEYETIYISRDDKKDTVYLNYRDLSRYETKVAKISLNKTNLDKLINKLVDMFVEMEKKEWM